MTKAFVSKLFLKPTEYFDSPKTPNSKLDFDVLKDSFNGFLEHKVMKMSAALAYTTMFSLGPLLLVILFLLLTFCLQILFQIALC